MLAALLHNPLFSAAEQLRTNHFVHEFEDVPCLRRLHANVRAEIARRTAQAARQRHHQATFTTLDWLRLTCFRDPRLRQTTSRRVPSAPLPDRTDRRAGTFNHRAAARFQPAGSLTLTHLLSNPAR